MTPTFTLYRAPGGLGPRSAYQDRAYVAVEPSVNAYHPIIRAILGAGETVAEGVTLAEIGTLIMERHARPDPRRSVPWACEVWTTQAVEQQMDALIEWKRGVSI